MSLTFTEPVELTDAMTIPQMLGIPEDRMSALQGIYYESNKLDNIPASLAFISREVATPQELIFLSHLTLEQLHATR